MTFTPDEVHQILLQYAAPFFRVSAFIIASPLIGSKPVPARIKIILALTLTVFIAPLVEPVAADFDPLSGAGMLFIVGEIMIGLAMGFALQLMFNTIVHAGQVVGMQMALGFAQMMDPQTGVSVPVISQFFNIFAILLFLALDGHLVLVATLHQSYEVLPLGLGLSRAGLWELLMFGAWLFAGAVTIALPIVIGLLMINIVMGVVTRATPQLNIFSVGFVIIILSGFVLILATLPSMALNIQALFDKGFEQSLFILTQ